MVSKYMMEALQTAMKGNQHIKIINNTDANGDDYTIKPYETCVIVDNDSTYTQNLFLPYLAEVDEGHRISIRVTDFGGGGTIADNDESEADWSDLTYDADGEYAIIEKAGRSWITVKTDM